MYLMRRTYGSRAFFTLSSEWEEKRKKTPQCYVSVALLLRNMLSEWAWNMQCFIEATVFHYSKSSLSLVKTHKKKKKIGLHMHVVALRKIFYYNIIVFLIVVITLQLLLISLHRISTTRICHSLSPELKYTSVCCCVVQPTSVAYYPGSLKRLLVLRNLSIVVCEISTLQFISETENFPKWIFSSNHR